ncbi:PQQ-binding-like beta-propeller repeat protein [Streptomyces phaeoluteigriseus]|uniref:serine/threonine-protein kinase n=1 Tax=Streptomyces phaeoluteigriseus TaxID=114686 RepID=UPI001301BE88|nr:serine/threonine-protein kinase [Streptomyces phaeoluteigriseus]
MAGIEHLQPNDPKRIGPYRVKGKLGAGGMGTVYLGESTSGRLVAVKVIHGDLLDQPGFHARFRREVELARAVSGAFTAAVVDADPEGDPAWLATLYIAGPSLADAVKSVGALPRDEVWTLAAGIVEALMAIHDSGLVHRDLKPANILLAGDGLRVIDFGISRAVDQAAITHTGVVLGTPGYMSPEQVIGAPVGPSSDVFSLGCVLACAAAGAAPFGNTEPFGVFYRIVHEEPDLSALPVNLRELIAACLAKNPYARPSLREVLAFVGREMNGGSSQGATSPEDATAEFAVPIGSQLIIDASASDAAIGETYHPRIERQAPHEALTETMLDVPKMLCSEPPAHQMSASSVAPLSVPQAPQGCDSFERPADISLELSVKHRRRRGRVILAVSLAIILGMATFGLQRYGFIDLGPSKPTVAGPSSLYDGTYRSGANRLGSYDEPIRRPVEWRPWNASLKGTPTGCTFSRARLFCASKEGRVVALNAATGAVVWSSSNLGRIKRGPTAYGGLLYVASDTGRLAALSQETGRTIWATELLGAATMPAVVGDVVYTSSGGGRIYAIDAKTGNKKWSISVEFVPSIVSVISGKVYFTGRDGSVAAASTQSGSLVWKTRLQGRDSTGQSARCGTPAVTASHLYCTANDGTIYAFSVRDGKRQWTYKMQAEGDRTVSVQGDDVYGADSSGRVYALDARTGMKRWSEAVPGGVVIPPLLVGRELYLGTGSGHLVVLDPSTGAWKRTLSPAPGGVSSAMVADPLIGTKFYYAASENGEVYSRRLTS